MTDFNRKKFTKQLREAMRELTGKGNYQIHEIGQGHAFSLSIKKEGKVDVVDVYNWRDIESGQHSLDTIRATVKDALNGIFYI